MRAYISVHAVGYQILLSFLFRRFAVWLGQVAGSSYLGFGRVLGGANWRESNN